jgi:chromosome segregation ATPase
VDATGVLALAIELEQRDGVLSAELEAVDELAERIASVRGRAEELRVEAARHPQVRSTVVEALDAARDAERAAGAELARAEAALERAPRRAGAAERDQLEREHRRAREAVIDAAARVSRSEERLAGLDARAHALAALGEGLLVEAGVLAAELSALPRVGDQASSDEIASLEAVEDWGAHARAALFVARGTLGSERERLVLEANALGAAVLGDELGATSVSLVRRRIEVLVSSGAR